MANNQTLIAIPINLEEPLALRQFLIKLVEKIDVVFGYRGGDSFVSTSQLLNSTEALASSDLGINSTLTQLLLALETAILAVITELDEELSTKIDNLKSPTTVNNLSWSKPTVTNPPTQAEVQLIADQADDNVNKINELLAVLRATEIIAT